MSPHRVRTPLRDTEGSNLIPLPPMGAAPSPAMPQFTWDQLETELAALRPERAMLARRLVAVLRSRSAQRPSDELLREVLCTVWTVLEDAEG
ncbi:MAG: hypothetical protein WCY15_03880 [Phenylobacterium sp.]|uniref:hypothetical protein n=1 Tax=Phenylobacterium sp. TaxID=1871053 RepID=UPI002A348D79|nr:hypothetical protein [Phenylobacterium sp.]MDD3836996.1 hypothetical protein [Phenylobacterium sp.]MDX9998433.1 hypothetical protein [Phenylobacterium sp.]